MVGDVNGGEVHLQGGGAGGAEAFKAGEEALVVDRQLLLFLELGDHDDQEMMIMIMTMMKRKVIDHPQAIALLPNPWSQRCFATGRRQ